MERNKDCIYYTNCEYEDKHCEHNKCNRGVSIQHLLDTSNIPKRYMKPLVLYPSDRDVQAFTTLKSICEDCINFVYDGKSLYIHSENCGNGKTSWGIKFLLNYFHNIWDDYSSFDLPEGMYVNVPDFFARAKDNMTLNDPNFILFKQDIMKARVVVFDDIAVRTATNYEYDTLYVLINNRYDRGLCNIFTSNIDPNSLHLHVGERVATRIINNDCTIVEIVGEDRR